MTMINLKNMELKELEAYFEEIGEKKFRAKQVFQFIYKGVTSIDQMTNLSKDLREKLKKGAYISSLKIDTVQESKQDGTKKFLFELEDGNCIESVFMKYKYGNTLCVSSQAGCRMGCKFCASTLGGLKRNLTGGEIADEIIAAEKYTGEKIGHVVVMGTGEPFDNYDASTLGGLKRNLTGGEIADEIIAAEKYTGEKIGHVVVMGTGEPFDNYDNLSKFVRLINDKNGLNIGMRNITVSTCGIVPKIKQFAEDFPQVNLAISLHSPNDEIRKSMMPIANSYSIEELLDACKEYVEKTHRRITFEYTLVDGKNDSREHIEELSEKLRGMLCHVNLIPLNKVVESGLEAPTRKHARGVAQILENKGIPATVRRKLGADIDGACGQLRLSKK